MSGVGFSRRFGHGPASAEITVRNDAPLALREGLVMLANNLGLDPHNARLEVCGILLRRPDPSNWSAYPNVAGEVEHLVLSAPWHRVYDIAEGFFERLRAKGESVGEEFEARLNELFREHGIGWEMNKGEIVARGSESFNDSIKDVVALAVGSSRTSTAAEFQEAHADLSRRPEADVTGAIQHAMAGLECVSRDLMERPKDTLGQLVGDLSLPPPLDAAVMKLWGFASEQGRHLREGRRPRFEDAELVVGISSAVSVYLLRRDESKKAG